MKNLFLKLTMPFIIILIALALSWAMIGSRAELPRRETANTAPQIEVLRIEPTNWLINIRSQGTVKAMQEIDLVSEVSGRVISVSPEFVSGGQVSAGAVLLQIDPIDYEVAIADARAALAAAELRLSEVKVVIMRAAIDEAEATVKAREARLRQALADLENTKIKAPFDAIIDAKHVDLGQYVTAGLPLMRLLGTDTAEVRLPILASDLPFIQSDQFANGKSPRVLFTTVRGNKELRWQGHIARLEKRVDKQTRVFHLVAVVTEPYNSELHPALFSVGLFVDATIKGVTIPDTIRIPRSALHNGSFVFLVENNRLKKRAVKVLRREQDSLIIEEGLDRGDVLVLSRLDLMVEGIVVSLATPGE